MVKETKLGQALLARRPELNTAVRTQLRWSGHSHFLTALEASSMERKNFEAFNRVALHLLVKLFESFPGKLDIEANGLGLEAKPKSDGESFGEVWDNMQLGCDTVSWLNSEGFIDVEKVVYGGHFLGVRLTLKGLTLLGFTPGPDQSTKDRTLIDKARDALLSSTQGAATEVIKELFLNSIRLLPRTFL